MALSYAVGCLPGLPQLVARVSDALHNSGRILPFRSADDALQALTRDAVECTIVALDSETYDRDLGWIRKLRSAFPRHPVIVWCDQRKLTSDQIIAVTALGVCAYAFRGVTDSRLGFSQLLSEARTRTGTRPLEQRLAEIFPEEMRPFFVIAIRRAAEPLDVRRAAAALGVTRQTLRNRLVAYGLPRPQTFLVWCRLLAAASLLDERGRTLDSVALQLNFSTGQNLGAALRRYVGANITTLRFGEVSPAVEAEFRRIIQRGIARASQRASLPPSTPKD